MISSGKTWGDGSPAVGRGNGTFIWRMILRMGTFGIFWVKQETNNVRRLSNVSGGGILELGVKGI